MRPALTAASEAPASADFEESARRAATRFQPTCEFLAAIPDPTHTDIGEIAGRGRRLTVAVATPTGEQSSGSHAAGGVVARADLSELVMG